MNLELSRPDQTTVLFFLFSAIGLVRERRVLPFLILLVGMVFHGPMVAALVAGLVTWHRIDRSADVWIRLKDFIGVFLIMSGAISSAPFQEFYAFSGVLLLSLSFGGGLLGVLPALLLLRQYYPQPERIEIPLIAAGVYWVAAESFHWIKTPHAKTILNGLEVLCVFGILYGFSGEFERWSMNPTVITLASILLFVSLALFAWTRWRLEGFKRGLVVFRSSALQVLTLGSRLIDGRQGWGGAEPERAPPTLGGAMDRAFYLVAGTLLFFGLFVLAVKGGF